MADQNAEIQATYRYDPWGAVTTYTASGGVDNSTTSIGAINPLRYRSYYYDVETGFYYLQTRYYDPQIGRFINADDVSILKDNKDSFSDKNLFCYCDNNPINRIDTDGEYWCFAAIAFTSPAGLILLAGIVTITAIYYYQNIRPRNSTYYSKAKSRYSRTHKKGIVKKKIFEAPKSSRSKNLPAKRLKFNTRKRAKQAAQRASKGKKPRHDSKSRIRNPHFHPKTKNEHRITPKGHGKHDHYYYPKRRY